MPYRGGNVGCLWLALLILLLGGTPLLIGVIRVFAGFVLVAVVAAVAASWWLRRRAVRFYTESQSAEHNRFVELLVALLVRLAEIDGDLDRREVAAIRTFFQRELGYRGERLVWLRDLVKESRRARASTETLCRELGRNYGIHARFIVLEVLTRVAEADGRISPEEQAFIAEVTGLLGLGRFSGGFDFGTGRSPRPRHDSIEEALATLGLAEGVASEDIKKTWRRLAMENHPDRAAHLGPEFRRIAEEQMRKINAAYEVLKDAGLAA